MLLFYRLISFTIFNQMKIEDELIAPDLSHGIKLTAQWPIFSKFMITQGIIMFDRYIMTPLQNLVYFDELTNNQHLCEEILIENQSKNERFSIQIENRMEVINVDKNKNNFIVYLKIDPIKTKRRGSKIIKFANISFANIEETLSTINSQKNQISAINVENVNSQGMASSFLNQSQEQQLQFSQNSDNAQDSYSQEMSQSPFYKKYSSYQYLTQRSKIQPPNNFVPLSQKIKKRQESLNKERIRHKNSDKVRILLHDIATLNYQNGEYYQAIQILKQALPIAKHFHGKNSQQEGSILHSLGLNYRSINQYDTALQYLNQSLKINKNIKEQSNLVANTLLNIGNVYDDKNDIKKALQFYKESLRIMKKIGTQSIERADVLNNIALMLQNQQKYNEAEAKYLLILQIEENQYGNCSYEVAVTTYNLSLCHFKMGKYQSGFRGYKKTFSIMKALKLWKHPDNNKWIQSFKISLRNLLKNSKIYRGILLKGVNIIESFFTGEYADAEIRKLRDQLKEKAEK